MPHRIPKNPSLEFDRKAAKALLQKCLEGDAVSCQRVLQHHPRFRARPAEELKTTSLQLSDTQLVLAREYGFPSWPRWKQFVETLKLDAAARAGALLKAACSNNVAHAQSLLDHDPELARYDLYTACACGETDLVRRQLQSTPALANKRGGPNAWLPLQYACQSRFLRSDPRRAGRIVDTAEVLLRHGANPNLFHTPEWQGVLSDNTPLFGAAGIANNARLTKMLLDAGADPDEGCPAPDPRNHRASPWGTEALYHASEFRDLECLRLLLQAKPHPFRVAYCLGRMLDFNHPAGVKLYLEFGADPNFHVPWSSSGTHFLKAVINGRPRETLEALVAHGADVNAANASGVSAYRLAVRYGHTDTAEFLKEKGAKTDDLTPDDLLLAAAWRGERAPDSAGARKIPPGLLGRAAKDDDVAAIECLLAAGADVNAPDSLEHGIPPLHAACWRGRLHAARAMLAAGADIQQRNCYGGDAMGTTIHGSANCFDPEGGPGMKLPDEAVHGQYVEILELLLQAGAKLPQHIEDGSEAVKEFLRSKGVNDLD